MTSVSSRRGNKDHSSIPLSPLDEEHHQHQVSSHHSSSPSSSSSPDHPRHQPHSAPSLLRTTTEPPAGLGSSEGNIMERIRRFFRAGPEYAPLNTSEDGERDHGTVTPKLGNAGPVSKFDYMVFVVLGVAMLWAWNCFLAAAAYFQMRFAKNRYILDNFQSSVLTVSTISTLATTLILAKLQKNASYTYRIMTSLFINVVVFAILAASTVLGKGISAKPYFAFLLSMVFSTSIAQGLIQNGLFSFVSSFGPIYVQAVMTGQGIAGVLPAITQIAAVLAIPPKSTKGDAAPNPDEPTASPKSAFVYFLTASGVSIAAILCFSVMLQRQKMRRELQGIIAAEAVANTTPLAAEDDDDEVRGGGEGPRPVGSGKKAVSLQSLFVRLKFLAVGLILTFAITMCFPVFTQAIVSTHPSSESRLFEPSVFIPLGFLMWNIGDLSGRLLCANPKFTTDNPVLLLILSICRLGFIPLYMLCNIKGRGATVNGDLFYWAVQVAFGLSNGWLGSNIIMSAPSYVEDDEKEACGGFMGLCLIAGLAAGSVMSFGFNI